MADRIETFDVTIPKGTVVASPYIEALPFNQGLVTNLEIIVPPGPSGLMGFRIRHSGETVIPYNRDNWIIADNEPIKWPLSGFPTGAAWDLQGYNLDVYDHTLYLRFLVSETARNMAVYANLVPIAPGATAED